VDVWLLGFGYEPWDMHNDLLRVLVVWGIVGVAVTCAVVVGLHRFLRNRIDRSGRLALALLLVTLVVFGLTQKPLAYPYFLWLFFFGQMVVLAVHGERTSDETPVKSGAMP
jgi:O-antigen ligase